MFKKYTAVFTIVLLFVFCSLHVSAAAIKADFDILKEEASAHSEIIGTLEKDVLSWINDARKQNNRTLLPADFKPDLTSAVKHYIDAEELFSLNTSDMDVIYKYLNSLEYVWIYELVYDNTLFQISIEKGGIVTDDVIDIFDLNLSEEEDLAFYEQLKEEEGKWRVASMTIISPSEDDSYMSGDKITSTLERLENPGNDVHLTICGGAGGLDGYIAIVEDRDIAEADLIIPLTVPDIQGTDEEIHELLADNASVEDNVYDYEAFMNAANNMPDMTYNEEMSGGSGGLLLPSAYPQYTGSDVQDARPFHYSLIIIAGLCIIVTGTAGIIYRRKN